jgi:hypothetical protein
LFFGVFPDLVAFTIPACLRIWWRLTGATRSLLPTPNGPHFEWVWTVYNWAHSLLVFGLLFAGLWLVMRVPGPPGRPPVGDAVVPRGDLRSFDFGLAPVAAQPRFVERAAIRGCEERTLMIRGQKVVVVMPAYNAARTTCRFAERPDSGQAELHFLFRSP